MNKCKQNVPQEAKDLIERAVSVVMKRFDFPRAIQDAIKKIVMEDALARWQELVPNADKDDLSDPQECAELDTEFGLPVGAVER